MITQMKLKTILKTADMTITCKNISSRSRQFCCRRLKIGRKQSRKQVKGKRKTNLYDLLIPVIFHVPSEEWATSPFPNHIMAVPTPAHCPDKSTEEGTSTLISFLTPDTKKGCCYTFNECLSYRTALRCGTACTLT